jgi:hypothetical protein
MAAEIRSMPRTAACLRDRRIGTAVDVVVVEEGAVTVEVLLEAEEEEEEEE